MPLSQDLTAFAAAMRRSKLQPRTRYLYLGSMRRFDAWMRTRGGTVRTATFEQIAYYADKLPFTYASRQTFIRAHKKYWCVQLRRKPEDAPSNDLFCPK